MVTSSHIISDKRQLTMSSFPKVRIEVGGVCFSEETNRLMSYSPFLASVFNSIKVCPCEPQVIIVADLRPNQMEEALSGKISSILQN